MIFLTLFFINVIFCVHILASDCLSTRRWQRLREKFSCEKKKELKNRSGSAQNLHSYYILYLIK